MRNFGFLVNHAMNGGKALMQDQAEVRRRLTEAPRVPEYMDADAIARFMADLARAGERPGVKNRRMN